MKNKKQKHDLLDLLQLSSKEIYALLKQAKTLKTEAKKGKFKAPLKNKTLAMLFEKNSTRTRVSFEVAMYQLGGHALMLDSRSSQLGRGETIADTAKVLSRYVDAIMYRCHGHSDLEELAKYATVPVINGLSDASHPVQVLADLQTAAENKINLAKMKACFLGDFNNVAKSWVDAARVLGFQMVVAAPKSTWPKNTWLQESLKYKNITVTEDPIAAVKYANVINTDTWVSMGQSDSKNIAIFKPYQINQSLLKHADRKAIVLHCLPAHRGDEITDEVMDGPASRVFDQAENRLHIQKAILQFLLK